MEIKNKIKSFLKLIFIGIIIISLIFLINFVSADLRGVSFDLDTSSQSQCTCNITGNGTINYLSMWLSENTLGNSPLYLSGDVIKGDNIFLGTSGDEFEGIYGNNIYSGQYSSANFKSRAVMYSSVGAGGSIETNDNFIYDEANNTLTVSNINSGNICYSNGVNCTNTLNTIYYNATSVSSLVGSVSGSLGDIQTYNGVAYNITEASSDYTLLVNFTVNQLNFTNIIIRQKSSVDTNHFTLVQLWSYPDNIWEDYGLLTEKTTYEIQTFGVYDAQEHVKNGVVQLKLNQTEIGGFTHVHQFDWVGLSGGVGIPIGEETDPFWIQDKPNYYNKTTIDNFNGTGNFSIAGKLRAKTLQADDINSTNINATNIQSTKVRVNGNSLSTYYPLGVSNNVGSGSSWVQINAVNTQDYVSGFGMQTNGESGNQWLFYRYGAFNGDKFCIGMNTISEPFCIDSGGTGGVMIGTGSSASPPANGLEVSGLIQSDNDGFSSQGQVGISGTYQLMDASSNPCYMTFTGGILTDTNCPQ